MNPSVNGPVMKKKAKQGSVPLCVQLYSDKLWIWKRAAATDANELNLLQTT